MQPIETIRFYGILDTGYVSPAAWIAKYDALAAGGAGIIQVRAKRETASEGASLVKQVVEHRATLGLAHEDQPYLVINDDLDLCLAYPGLGLHVGQDDLSPLVAREQLGPDRILGLSTHSLSQAQGALSLETGTLDYFAVGPVFPTQTKPDYKAVGLDLVRQVSVLQPQLPFFCIGGINRQNIAQVKAAGARSIVTVSDVLCSDDTAQAVRDSIATLETD